MKKWFMKLLGFYECYNCGVIFGRYGAPMQIDKAGIKSFCERCFNPGLKP
jgi:hypothetical protein